MSSLMYSLMAEIQVRQASTRRSICSRGADGLRDISSILSGFLLSNIFSRPSLHLDLSWYSYSTQASHSASPVTSPSSAGTSATGPVPSSRPPHHEEDEIDFR